MHVCFESMLPFLGKSTLEHILEHDNAMPLSFLKACYQSVRQSNNHIRTNFVSSDVDLPSCKLPAHPVLTWHVLLT